MRNELYNISQTRWISGLVEIPVEQEEELVSIFNNTQDDIIYTLHKTKQRFNSSIIISPGTFKKVRRLKPDEYCVILPQIGSRLIFRRDYIRNKLLIINSSSHPYSPGDSLIRRIEKWRINYMLSRGEIFYIN